MRITSLLAAVVATLTFAVTGCGGTYVPDEAPASESIKTSVQTDQQSNPDQNVHEMTVCPLKWACDTTGLYYSTQAQCTAACGATPCYRDYACTGNCVCP
ncbi:MAG: hypothetical protein ACJ8AT_16685 [Hyalangium sp.]|uniref:hypothetical protein n=1 Tax=Hyalangium sp. TaxID=2028555 RepID=UPI003899CFDA